MERKWFVHAKGRQEGPLSLEEVRKRLSSGQIAPQDHAWREGLDDWKCVEDIVELRMPAMRSSTEPHFEEASAILDLRADSRPIEHTDVNRLKAARKEAARVGRIAEAASGISTAGVTDRSRRRSPAPFFIFVLLVLALFLGIAYQQGAFDRWLARVPRVEELTIEENDDLSSAARADLAVLGPSLAFALSHQNPASPVVFIATNLPDGTHLELRVHGIGPTLVNEIEFEALIPVTISQRFAKSPPIRRRDGSAIPAGQYQITVSDGPEQPEASRRALSRVAPIAPEKLPAWIPLGRRVFAKKTFTLLGGIREDSYTTLLRDYHAKLREQAGAEARELNDWIAVVGRSFDSTRAAFERLKALPANESRAKQWGEFDEEWKKELAPYSDKLEEHKPGSIQGRIYFGSRYRMIHGAWTAARRVHDLHTAFLTTRVDAVAYNREISEAVQQAEGRLSSLRAKMSETEKNWNPTGYPPRDE